MTYVIVSYLLKRSRIGAGDLIIFLMVMFLSLATGVVSRLMGIYILRYLVVPAYYGMFIAVPPLVYLLIKGVREERLRVRVKELISYRGVALLILVLAVTAISGVQDPARSPWNGEPRLAPVTLDDRIEMRNLHQFFSQAMLYVGVHDTYIDPTKPVLKGLTHDYHSSEEVIKCLLMSDHYTCNSRALQTLHNINSLLLLIIYESTVNKNCNYSIIASLNEHVILYVTNFVRQ